MQIFRGVFLKKNTSLFLSPLVPLFSIDSYAGICICYKFDAQLASWTIVSRYPAVSILLPIRGYYVYILEICWIPGYLDTPYTLHCAYSAFL